MEHSKIIDEIVSELELFKQESNPYYGKCIDIGGIRCLLCGRAMSFYLEGNIAGAFGVFECSCGYRDASIENACDFATHKDWDRFWKETEDIMW